MAVPLILRLFLAPFQLFLYWISTWTHFTVDKSKSVIVVTGCDSGFGLATAQRLHELGFIVVATCLTPAGVENLAGKVSLAIRCDITKSQDISDLYKATVKIIENKEARLWALINNAGIAPSGFLDWMDIKYFRKVMDVNYFAVVEMIQTFLPQLKKTKNSRVINVSSMAGLTGFLNGGAYCASKHAVEGMTKCVRQELLTWNIHMANINPAFMKTPLIASSTHETSRIFDEASAEIRSQYNRENFERMTHLIEAVQEDPILVVNEIIRNVTVKAPQPVNAVGWQAFALRYVTTQAAVVHQ